MYRGRLDESLAALLVATVAFLVVALAVQLLLNLAIKSPLTSAASWILLFVPLALGGGAAVLIYRLVLYRHPTSLAGTCSKCTYDLRGTSSGICPECGMPIPGQPITSVNSVSTNPVIDRNTNVDSP
jgi:hypothetical protein